MSWFMENWYVVVSLVVFAVSVGLTLYKFFRLPTAGQIAKVKEGEYAFPFGKGVRRRYRPIKLRWYMTYL